jgi:uncharacterized protein (DUF1778 family)
MAAPQKNDARLDFRLNREQKSLIDRAACLAGQSVTDFATATLIEKAKGVIQEHEVRVLSNRDRDIFLALLDSDAEPNAALKQAAKRFKRHHG